MNIFNTEGILQHTTLKLKRGARIKSLLSTDYVNFVIEARLLTSTLLKCPIFNIKRACFVGRISSDPAVPVC